MTLAKRTPKTKTCKDPPRSERPATPKRKSDQARASSAYRKNNAAKVNAANLKYYHGHPEYARAMRLKHRYGITINDFDRMLKKQNGVCAICGKPPKNRRLDIDHCHKTGKVRGLLCHRCNRGLPWFSDNPATLRAAAEYLSK